METQSGDEYLKGKLLIAMPGMADPRFVSTVILMLYHDAERAMGVVINKPAGFMQIAEAKDDNPEEALETEQVPVYYGGPVEHEVALILHSADRSDYESTRMVNEHFCVTSTPHILKDISNGTGPVCRLFLLGYASWGPGQLENELRRNDWLIGNSTPEIVFKTSAQNKWDAAIQALGIHPGLLSTHGGNA